MIKNYPLPSEKQAEWADMELGVIIHHCLETYHPDIPMNKWKCSRDKMSAESFAPSDENTDQWMKCAAKMGAKYAIFVTNHVTGFSMWPTKENKYSIESSPFKEGKADIVKDFIRSCKKYGIAPGLYYSTGCNGYYDINDETFRGDQSGYKTEKYKEYVAMVERQLAEIWGNYGELFEIWFDGGIVPYDMGGPDIMKLIKKYQPNAVCFQGPEEHFQNLRWVGNERGVAPINCWSTSLKKTQAFGGEYEDDVVGIGNPDGECWNPAETDMGNRKQEAFGGGWGWAENEEHLVYSPEELMERYMSSVGRNSNLLIGMAISKRGHFEDEEQFRHFGELVKELYHNPVKAFDTQNLAIKVRDTYEYSIELDSATFIKNAVIMEEIHKGERVREFRLEISDKDGCSEVLFSAECIGHKRIIPIHKEITSAKLTISKWNDTPVLKEFCLYG